MYLYLQKIFQSMLNVKPIKTFFVNTFPSNIYPTKLTLDFAARICKNTKTTIISRYITVLEPSDGKHSLKKCKSMVVVYNL